MLEKIAHWTLVLPLWVLTTLNLWLVSMEFPVLEAINEQNTLILAAIIAFLPMHVLKHLVSLVQRGEGALQLRANVLLSLWIIPFEMLLFAVLAKGQLDYFLDDSPYLVTASIVSIGAFYILLEVLEESNYWRFSRGNR